MTDETAGVSSSPVRLYNTLSRQVEHFVPLNPPRVLMYTCGPTVYHFAHIGNMRSFLTADVLRRVLTYNGYDVVSVKNITDVGHLRDEVAESGADRIEAAAREENRAPEEIADFYTQRFIEDERSLNILPPTYRPKATEYIPQMIDLASRLLEKGYAYQAQGNVYFDVRKFPSYGALSGNRLETLVAGQRVDIEPDKRDPVDFALWKAADPYRLMKWDSPWGSGFPGWHIECSAMAMSLLGPQLDIHTGGMDNLFPHHEDERAQSEADTDRMFVRYWVHTAHLLVADERMAKSSGNFFTLTDVIDRGIHPLAYRYFAFQTDYRKQLNLTWEALEAAQIGLDRIWDQAAELLQESADQSSISCAEVAQRFRDEINDDLAIHRGLVVLHDMLADKLPASAKLALLEDMDRVLGLDIRRQAEIRSKLSPGRSDSDRRARDCQSFEGFSAFGRNPIGTSCPWNRDQRYSCRATLGRARIRRCRLRGHASRGDQSKDRPAYDTRQQPCEGT